MEKNKRPVETTSEVDVFYLRTKSLEEQLKYKYYIIHNSS